MNYSVIGDTVNLASRLVELAPRGEIYMSAETYKLVSNVAVAEGPFPTSLRGKAERVNIFKLKDLKGEDEKVKVVMGRDEFVGRTKELQTIQQAFARVLGKNQARLFIRGEAGVGKSRLKAELVKMAYRSGIATYEGACSSFETNTPYYLWATLLRNLLKITPQTAEADARRRLHQTIHTLALDEHEPYLATLLSIRYDEILLVDDALRKQRIFQAMRSILSALSLRRPMTIILEDLHWIDRFSQELLEYIFSRTNNVVLSLFVLIFREEYTQSKTMMEDGELLDLNRLNRGDALKLIKLRLEVDTVPPKVEELILKRSEGNPFFIQELIKTLVDKKILAVRRRSVEILSDNIEAGIPGTIQGVIMARIDRLQDNIKDVLFSASVIGREFSSPLLEQVIERRNVIEPSLDQLQTLELILPKNQAQEYEFLFKHYLIQEVAYNTILVNKRKELHQLIAGAIEQLYAERIEEFYELLAFHYEKAEQWDKAAEYLSRSGHKLGQIYSKEEGNAFFERKNAAVSKLYQAASAKASLWGTLKAISVPLVAMLIPILPIFIYVKLLGRTKSDNLEEVLIIGIIASLLCVWYALSLWYLGVVPFLRGRPKLYDLMEDQIRVIYKDGTTLSIDFSEIRTLRLLDAKSQRSRPFLRKLVDPFGRVSPGVPMDFSVWFREVVLNFLPPYSFGFGSGQEEILISLNAGHRIMRAILPWWNTPVRSRDLSILPFDGKQFFSQFQVAFAKWKKQKL